MSSFPSFLALKEEHLECHSLELGVDMRVHCLGGRVHDMRVVHHNRGVVVQHSPSFPLVAQHPSIPGSQVEIP